MNWNKIFYSGSLCNLWWTWSLWCLLLQGVHHSGKGQRWLPQNCQPRYLKNGLILRKEEIRIQKKIAASPVVVVVTAANFCFFTLKLWLDNKGLFSKPASMWINVCRQCRALLFTWRTPKMHEFTLSKSEMKILFCPFGP